VSNAKLLRLHDRLSAVKNQFGSRETLVGAIMALEKRSKDAGYKARLEKYPLPRLLDLHGASTRRAKHAEAKSKAAKPAKPAAPAAKKSKAREARPS
jgi:hypothetical protein